MRHRDLWAGEAARRGIACVGIAARRHRMGGGCSGRAMHLITAAAHAGSGDSVRSPLASDGHAVDSGHDGSMGEIGRRGAMRHRAGNGPCAADESVCRDVCRAQWMGLADGSHRKMRARDGHGSTRDVSGRMRRSSSCLPDVRRNEGRGWKPLPGPCPCHGPGRHHQPCPPM